MKKQNIGQFIKCDYCGNMTKNGVYVLNGKQYCTKTCTNKAAHRETHVTNINIGY